MVVMPIVGSKMNKKGLYFVMVLNILCSKYSVMCLREYAKMALKIPIISEAKISLKYPFVIIFRRSKIIRSVS